jgi:hypothetical protein
VWEKRRQTDPSRAFNVFLTARRGSRAYDRNDLDDLDRKSAPMPRFGSEFAIFLLFFGAALLDSIRHGEWLMSIVYVCLALLFLFAGARRSAAGAGSAK